MPVFLVLAAWTYGCGAAGLVNNGLHHWRVRDSSSAPLACWPPRPFCRFQRGYRNVINKGIELNAAGVDCELMMETSGHGALRENRRAGAACPTEAGTGHFGNGCIRDNCCERRQASCRSAPLGSLIHHHIGTWMMAPTSQ